jgi:hypothetical protein
MTMALRCPKCGAGGNGVASCDCGEPWVSTTDYAAIVARANPEKSIATIARELGIGTATVSIARRKNRGGAPFDRCPTSSKHPVSFDGRNVFYGLPRSQEVNSIYIESHTRTAIAVAVRGKGGRDLWPMILDAIDQGLAKPNGYAGRAKLSLRTLFTNWPIDRSPRAFVNRYDLRDRRHREYVRNVIWPIALAHKAAVLADPTCLEALVAKHQHEYIYIDKPLPPTKIEPTLSPLPIDVRHLECLERPPEHPAPIATPPQPASKVEPRVVMYGQTLWPRPSYATYTFDQLRAAIRYFQDLLRLVDDSRSMTSPAAWAIAIRFSTRAIERFADKEILNLVDHLATLMEANPRGECDWPMMPANYKW